MCSRSNISAIEDLAASEDGVFTAAHAVLRRVRRLRRHGGVYPRNRLPHPDPHEIVAPRRFNSRMDGVRFPVKPLSEADIVWKSGVPVTCVETTVATLVDEGEMMAGCSSPKALETAVEKAARRLARDTTRVISEFSFHRLLCRVFSERPRHSFSAALAWG